MSHLELAAYDYDSDDCERTASVPDSRPSVESSSWLRGGGNSSSAGLAPVREQSDDVDGLPKIAPLPFSGKYTSASASEGGIVLTRGQSAGQNRLKTEQEQMQQKKALMPGLEPPEQSQMIGEREYHAPTSFDDVRPDHL